MHHWAALQALEALHGAAVAVWHLQRVLAKKRDPLSHVLFSDALQAAQCPSPLSHFWCDATRRIITPANDRCSRQQIVPAHSCDWAIEAVGSTVSTVALNYFGGTHNYEWELYRELATGALQKAFADAAAAGRAGLVRELLTAQFPRLARIFEDTIAKLLQDTEV
jgi:hypothetical protein